MYHDDLQYTKCRFMALAWMQRLEDILPSLIQKIRKQYQVDTLKFELLAMGSYNCCFRLKGLHSIIRFPVMCKSAFRYEKTTDESRTMTYISQYTPIPVPKLLAVESCDLGPYMILSFVDGTPLSDFLKAPQNPEAPVPIVLQPDIDNILLFRAYRSMATVLIELSRCRFPRIGAIGQNESADGHDGRNSWCVTKRAVTLNMNQLVSCGNYPPKALPQKTFTTANAYFAALAEVHLTHLRTQRNAAVDDEADCRKKYVARHLFLKIARNFSTEYNNGPFPLYCDDFRPTNVIVDSVNMHIRGVIDWEYCYAAPAELTYCLPWWLLLTHPDDWADGDLGEFLEQYRPRCEQFLKALQMEEDERILQGKISEAERLSIKMSQSLENGRFWFCLAATSSFGFDDIYWKFIDPVYYGEFTSIDDRLRLLNPDEQDGLDAFVEIKLQQAKEAELDEHVDSHEMFTA